MSQMAELDGTASADVEFALTAADAAREELASMPLSQRSQGLLAVADTLDSHAPELLPLAEAETGLTRPRLTSELRRTSVQLRLFADVVSAGDFLDVRIDEEDPDFTLGHRPDIRRYLVSVGPVVNFAASNFPFAFSTIGGDTTAALAAGSPVIVKGHPGHPRLSSATYRLVSSALREAGFPDGSIGLVLGQSQGVEVLTDERIRAATFTGSVQGGRALAEIAARRRIPIPFFGELSSVNPVFVTPQALVQRRDTLAAGFVGSVAGSAGQLCTKPGFLFVPADAELRDTVARRSADQPEHRLLNPHTGSGYRERRDTILSTPGVRLVGEGTLRVDDAGETWATPTIVAVDVETLKHQRDRLLDEAFGPLSILVEYGDLSELTEVARELFPGNLTGTVHLGEGEALAAIRPLLVQLARSCGRVLVNDWPTGVAVTPAMQHGGPFPSTTNDSGTSVGTAAITRLMRPVAYQGVPEQLLPVPLRDSNPWSVPQRRTAPGESARWGQLRTPTSPG